MTFKLSRTNMTSCPSIVATMNDTTTVLDSSSLKHDSRACGVTGAYSTFNIRQNKVEKNEGRCTKAKLKYARLQVVGREWQGKLVMKVSRVWRILSWMSTPSHMRSFIVWMIAGTAERETARREMRRWSELSTVMNT
jgi:hypothetical protein